MKWKKDNNNNNNNNNIFTWKFKNKSREVVTLIGCLSGEYFALDLPAELQGLGFEDTTQSSNDPVNTLTLARKRTWDVKFQGKKNAKL